MEISTVEKATVVFLGNETVALKTVGTVMGLEVYIIQVPDNTTIDGYTIVYTIGSYFQDTTNELLEMIRPITDAPTNPTNPTNPTVPSEPYVGTLNGNVYTNPFAGLKIEFEGDWSIRTADTIEGTMDYVENGVLTNIPLDTDFTVLEAESNDSLYMIEINYQEVDPTTAAFYDNDTMIDLVLLMKDALISSLEEEEGIIITNMEKVSISFLGNETSAIMIDFIEEGEAGSLLAFYDFTSAEGYGISYEIGALEVGSLEYVLGMIHPLNEG